MALFISMSVLRKVGAKNQDEWGGKTLGGKKP